MGLISCFNVIFCPPRLFDDLLGHLEAIMVSLTKNKGWVTIRTWLSFELQQIWDHFYYTNAPQLYSKCGLRFAVAQCIVGPRGPRVKQEPEDTLLTFLSMSSRWWSELFICNHCGYDLARGKKSPISLNPTA